MNKLSLTALLVTSVLSVLPAASYAGEAGDFVLRVRGIGVIPDEDVSITGAVTGSDIDIDNTLVPELDFSYFVTNNIALELIAATTPHEATAKNTSAGNLDLGEVWLLPPTLTVQYHFNGLDRFKPYVGAGVNYTVFYGEDEGSSITDMNFDNSFGPALQAGFDVAIDENWLVNFDVKKIWIDSEVSINGGAVRADVDIDPWIVGAGVGYKF